MSAQLLKSIRRRQCNCCKLGDTCMSPRITTRAIGNIPGCKTAQDFHPDYRRKYMINIHRVDPDDTTNADRWCALMQIWNLPAGDPRRAKYAGDMGWDKLMKDLDALKPKPVAW